MDSNNITSLTELRDEFKKFIEEDEIGKNILKCDKDIQKFIMLLLDLNQESNRRNIKYLDKLIYLTIMYVAMCVGFILILWVK